MSNEQINKGVTSLDDEALDTIAGGAGSSGQTEDKSKEQALADGRKIKVNTESKCLLSPRLGFMNEGCEKGHVWAKSYSKVTTQSNIYGSAMDCKCYKCGAVYAGWVNVKVPVTFEPN